MHPNKREIHKEKTNPSKSSKARTTIHNDLENFDFKALNEIRADLEAGGNYSDETINSVMEGLAELPHYAEDQNTTQGGKSD